MTKRPFVLLATPLAALALLLGLTQVPSGAAAPEGTPVGRFVVILQGDVDPGAVASEHASAHGGRIGFVYSSALRGYSATMSSTAAERIRADRRVRVVEPDMQAARTAAQPTTSGVDRVSLPDAAGTHSNLKIDGVDERVDADVAVIDGAADETHPDLNVLKSYDCTATKDGYVGRCDESTALAGDNHGTHVAGSVGAKDNGIGVVGVAPGARIWSLAVFDDADGGGYFSWITAAVDRVVAQKETVNGVTVPAVEVINMSLGCANCSSSALSTAIATAVNDGITVVVAAGNDGRNASSFFPANDPNVITVSALTDYDGVSGGTYSGGTPAGCHSDTDDTLAPFSNYGTTVEIAAPGVCVQSTLPGGTYGPMGGTSMASPHVAGAAALIASAAGHQNPAHVRSTLLATGNLNWTDNAPDGVTEPLLDTTSFQPVLVTPASPDPVLAANSAPTAASFTTSCSATAPTCSFSGSATDPDKDTLTYDWKVGSSSFPNANPLNIRFSYVGTYAITMTVSDGRGGSASAAGSVSCTKSKGVLRCRKV